MGTAGMIVRRMGSYSMSAFEALLIVSSISGPDESIKSDDIMEIVSSVRCVTVVAVDRSVMSQSSSVTYDDALLTRLCVCVCVCVVGRSGECVRIWHVSASVKSQQE
jgi:hypothetical protein